MIFSSPPFCEQAPSGTSREDSENRIQATRKGLSDTPLQPEGSRCRPEGREARAGASAPEQFPGASGAARRESRATGSGRNIHVRYPARGGRHHSTCFMGVPSPFSLCIDGCCIPGASPFTPAFACRPLRDTAYCGMEQRLLAGLITQRTGVRIPLPRPSGR